MARFAVLKNLGDTNSDGAHPYAALVLADETFMTTLMRPVGHGTASR